MNITAMKQALEALACMRDMVGHPDNLQFIDNAIAALRQAIEQAKKQEPVAWWTGEVYCDHDDFMYNQSKQEWIELNSTKPNRFPIPLYTAPPRKEWVGLTNEEAKEIWLKTHELDVAIKLIEAKLKERNNG